LTTMRKICQRLSAPAALCLALYAPMTLAGEAGSFFSIKPSVRVDWEAAQIDANGARTMHGSEFRRLGIGAVGKIGTLKYKAAVDPLGLKDRVSRHSLKMRDLWVSQKLGPGTLKVGQFKPTFSLDGTTGSDVSPFIERASGPVVLVPSFRKAVSWQMGGERGSVAANLWRLQKIGAPHFAGFGIGTRLTFAPLARAGEVRHLGVSLAHERHDHPGAKDMPKLNVRALTGAHLSKSLRPSLASFSAGRATDVEKWALEYAEVHGALSWQGEFSGARLGDGVDKALVLSEYGAVSWLISDHTRGYDAGSGRFAKIKGVTPKSPGWELAVRLDHIHGRQHAKGPDHINTASTAWTLASNWYLRPDFQLMLNLANTQDHDRLSGKKARFRELFARVQYDF